MGRVAEPFTESGDVERRCKLKAMDLLARRPHFRRQLEDKLRTRGFEDDNIAEVCDDLEKRGFLDDHDCARNLATGSLRRKGFGPRRLRAELAKRGAPGMVVEKVVSEAFRQGEKPLLRETASRWLERNEWDRGRLARYLERRGFSAGAIVGVLEELESQGIGRATGEAL